MSQPPAPAPERPGRVLVVDLLRGLALIAMAIYHGAWDLRYVGLLEVNVIEDPGWRWFARGIAASFLMLVGASLVLASRGGMKWGPYWRRLAMVALAAGAITVVTWYAFPRSFIFFGILHAIAVSSVLALPFLRLPALLTLVVGATILSAPLFATDARFNAPEWWWFGLATLPPLTNDWVPLVPWFGLVLIGMALMRGALWASPQGAWQRGGAGSGLGRGLRWLGRHSLAFYLIHQPVLFGAALLASQFLLPPALPAGGAAGPANEAAFHASCRSGCTAAGKEAELCRAQCYCVADRLRGTPSWPRILQDRPTGEDQALVRTAAARCLQD